MLCRSHSLWPSESECAGCALDASKERIESLSASARSATQFFKRALKPERGNSSGARLEADGGECRLHLLGRVDKRTHGRFNLRDGHTDAARCKAERSGG